MANLQGSSPNLQGGTGISLGNVNPQPAANFNVQSAQGISLGNIPTAPPSIQPTLDAGNSQIAAAQALLAQIKAQQAAQQSAYAPALNLTDIYNQAGNSSSVQGTNQYYTKKLQDFQAQQVADKVKQQQQTQMNIQNLQATLANSLSANALTQDRTTQDVATNEAQIAQKADQTQQDQGTQFDQARIAQAKQLASEGLTTSGLGGQQVAQSETDRNTQESRQAQDVAQQQQAQELFKTRTFEDLARSGDLAKQTETTGETQQNFDLNNYIDQQGRDLATQQEDLKQQNIVAANTAQKQAAQNLVNQFIQSIANPAQRQAAVQAYGSAFS